MGRAALPLGGHGEIMAEREETGWTAWAQFRHPTTGKTGRRQVRGHRTKGAAVAALKERLEKLAGGAQSGWTVARLVREWLASVEPTPGAAGISPQTFEQYARHSVHITRELGGLELAEVTTYDAEAFIAGLMDKRTGAGTGRARLTRVALSQACAWGVRQGLMPANPVPGTSAVKVKKKEPKALTTDEVRQLRELVHDWRPSPGVGGPKPRSDFGEIIDLLLGTGLRIGEAMALRWGDISLSKARLVVAGTMIERGKLERQPWGKSEGSYRSIPLRPWLVEMLRTRKIAAGMPDDEQPIFTTRTGAHLAPTAVRRTLRRVLDDSGLEWVTPHTFRKTTATLVEATSGLEAARAMLGHSSSEITEGFYIQRPDEVLESHAVGLDALAPA